MSSGESIWLVRTRSGDVLGPFSQRELIENLKEGLFAPDDEISQSSGQWMSAQQLTLHELDEVTRTSTRSQTVSSSASSNQNSNLAEKIEIRVLEESIPNKKNQVLAPSQPLSMPKPPSPTPIGWRLLGPAITALFVVIGLSTLVSRILPRSNNIQRQVRIPIEETGSEFLGNVSLLLRAG